MRAPLITTFYDTLGYCFEIVLGDLLGKSVRDSVYELLERNGIPRTDVSNRFDDVVEVMGRALGSCSRVVVHRTVAEMYKQYSKSLDFSYQDSLRDRLMLLKESVVSNHLVPRRLYEDSTFDDADKPKGPDAPTERGTIGYGYSSLYSLKKGVKTP